VRGLPARCYTRLGSPPGQRSRGPHGKSATSKLAVDPRALDSTHDGAARGKGRRYRVDLSRDSRRRLGSSAWLVAESWRLRHTTSITTLPRLEPGESERGDSRVDRVHWHSSPPSRRPRGRELGALGATQRASWATSPGRS